MGQKWRIKRIQTFLQLEIWKFTYRQQFLKLFTFWKVSVWAYRAGFSTELLLIQLTETWREAVDAGLVVAVAFIDFKKAFDSVSHAILETKLERDFGISGLLLDWLKSYLKER